MPFRDTNQDGMNGHAIVLGNDNIDGNHDIFFAAVELTRMPMVLTNPNLPDNPIIFANVAFLELTGYDREEIIGRNCRFLQGPNTDKSQVEDVRNAIDHKTDIATEILNYRKDGSAFWNALFISPVFNDAGQLLYYFASQLDVSRRRDAEDALRQSQKMEAVGQLTGGIAHDFNNLLTVVMGNIDAAAKYAEEPRQIKFLERAMMGAKKAEQLTGQLLAFARKQRLDTRPTSLNTLAMNMHALLGRTMGAHYNIETKFTDDPWVAHVDSVQAETSLLNLVVNARDAMPEGGTVLIETSNQKIEINDPLVLTGVLTAGSYAILTVSDTGVGIDPQNLKRVTEPFFTTKDVGRGTGMGLAMVYGFMRQSKGRLEIKSEVDKGTSISLWFPATDEQMLKTATEPKRSLKGGKETILVVEDNEDVMHLACAVLEDYGYNVMSAINGPEAMTIINDEDIHLDMVFTDIIMPGGINGIDVANHAIKRKNHPRILVTTGWSSHNGDDPAVDRLGYPVLSKPYMPDALVRKIRETLDGATGV